ncbi:tRNA-specific 2-thiouridylase [Catenibacillus scindens]|uniref:tRNA-specific 2-thiouridylase MnmA n=1 Tax=Catenibacillus scindens TaxID=673271 RepID=A0A7W8H8H9_9FIRM|nr:tRNA 2-thiouridine(34) synthase MnmA [Catenibacillus scindens]MBB5263821.1 tRNA-specific 2-thiouridylase [Catenibacillus scindens]
MMKKKVVVGMSGGVDSSVAAWLLKEQGYDVIGVTMQIWQDEDSESVEENGGCCGLSAVEDARRVAQDLDIPYYVMNFKEVFKDYVIDDFVSEYYQGRTPNPCIRCNRFVKWEALLNKSLALGADYIATGHYAQVVCLENGRYSLKAASSSKDQTYALYNLTQEQLSHTLMPVGSYTKDEIRKIAQKIGLKVAAKPDSQDICFVPDGDYARFLEGYTGKKLPRGNFVDQQGNVLGCHEGIIHYTIGQRKGLGLSMGHPVFVTQIRSDTNEVVIGENKDVFSRELLASSLNFMAIQRPEQPIRVFAKVRYAHKGAWATLEMVGKDKARCVFDDPVRAITPGQAVVFYDGDIVTGGGIIDQALGGD